jgi:hypothetical protein
MGMALGWLDIRKQLTTYTIALLVVATGGLNAVGAGLEGVGVGDEVDTYVFVSTLGLPPDGRYVRLAEADGVLYLQSCSHDNPLVAVTNQDVARLVPGQPSRDSYSPALLDIFIRHRTPQIGYRPRC